MQVKFKELNAVMNAIDALYHKAATKLGISDTESTVLYMLYEQGGECSQRDFYAESGVSRSTINTAIKRMEREGMIGLKAKDGRSTWIFLTEKGKEKAANTVERIIALENSIFDSWTEEDRMTAIRLNRDFLERFAAGMEDL